MSYEDLEGSPADARPVECYEFSHLGNIWRHTSADKAITLPVAGEFIPAPIRRGEIALSSETSSGSIEVYVPVTHPVGHLFVGPPPVDPVRLSIRRAHRQALADWRTIWSGRVDSGRLQVAGAEVVLQGLSPSALLDEELPGWTYGPICKRQLYSAQCGVREALFQIVATLTSVDGVLLHAAEFALQADGWYAGGWARTAGQADRFILAHAGDQIEVAAAIPGLQAGDAMTVSAGCDGLHATCRDKFSNLENHLGQKDIPTRDPYQGRMV